MEHLLLAGMVVLARHLRFRALALLMLVVVAAAPQTVELQEQAVLVVEVIPKMYLQMVTPARPTRAAAEARAGLLARHMARAAPAAQAS
jgi:hypothetical protein